MKIAYLSSQVTLPGSASRRSDAFEHDYMMEALIPAFTALDMSVTDVSWDDTSVDWTAYDAAIVGTTWDYWDRMDEFLAALDRISACTKLYNDVALIRWNIQKTYLKDLSSKGARLIPTLWLDHASPDMAKAAFDALGSDDLVFKRQVGAGAKDQHRLQRGDPIPIMPHPMMVQPFLKTIIDEGEISFVFIDGEFSHALIKRAAPGDYRIQSTYGGKEQAITPSVTDLESAREIMASLDTPPLYGRVDMLRDPDGRLFLMELELTEPYLYPLEGPNLGRMMAAAVARRLETGA